MPSCHTCPHNGKHHTRACLKCPGPAETDHHGRNHISLDSGEEQGQTLAEVTASMQAYRETWNATAAAATPDAQDDGRKVLYAILDLPTKHRNLILWRIQHPGVNLGEYARRYCKTAKTKQALYKRLADIARSNPLVAAIMGGTERRKQK